MLKDSISYRFTEELGASTLLCIVFALALLVELALG